MSLRSPILTDHHGLPRYWLIVWASLFTHHLKPASQKVKIRYIESFYAHADGINGSGYLDSILSAIDINEIGSALEAFFITLRNQELVNSSTEKQWQTCYAFVKDTTTHLSKSNIHINKLTSIEAKLNQLGFLYSQLKIRQSKKPDILRSLPVDV